MVGWLVDWFVGRWVGGGVGWLVTCFGCCWFPLGLSPGCGARTILIFVLVELRQCPYRPEQQKWDFPTIGFNARLLGPAVGGPPAVGIFLR